MQSLQGKTNWNLDDYTNWSCFLNLLVLPLAAILSLSASAKATFTIETVAGTGTQRTSGDRGPAKQADFTFPTAVAVDSNGVVYVSDAPWNIIRKIDPSGVISTIAGIVDGQCGYNGDDIPATAAMLNNPVALALDTNDNLYIADSGNNRIRKIDATSGRITTVYGDGNFSTLNKPYGIAVSNGNLYVADTNNDRVLRVNLAFGTRTELAPSAGITKPIGIAVDTDKNVYVTDNSRRILKLSHGGASFETYAGNGTLGYDGDEGPAVDAAFNNLYHLALDGNHNLYIADTDNNRIRKVDGATRIVTTIAGTGTADFSGDGGPANKAELHIPIGVALDRESNIYIADTCNFRVRRIVGSCALPTSDQQRPAPARSPIADEGLKNQNGQYHRLN